MIDVEFWYHLYKNSIYKSKYRWSILSWKNMQKDSTALSTLSRECTSVTSLCEIPASFTNQKAGQSVCEAKTQVKKNTENMQCSFIVVNAQ